MIFPRTIAIRRVEGVEKSLNPNPNPTTTDDPRPPMDDGSQVKSLWSCGLEGSKVEWSGVEPVEQVIEYIRELNFQ